MSCILAPDIESFIYINDEMGEDVKELFSEIRVIGTITNELSRQYQTKIYLCQKPIRSFNEFWNE